MNTNIEEAKRRLSLPAVMQEFGFGDRAKKNARCPFPGHEDVHPSFGIFQNGSGEWLWKCQSKCGHGDQIDFIAKVKGIDNREATKEFLRMAGTDKQSTHLHNSGNSPGGNSVDVYTPSKTLATVQPPLETPKIAYEPNILGLFRKDIRACGVVGEERLAETIYLLITSRLLDKPVSAVVKGLSSSGKSFTTEKVVEFFPKEAVITMTAGSERALVYSGKDYKHRTIVLYEATALREGAEDDLTSYFFRSLLSEGRINYSVTVRDPEDGQFKTKDIIKEGPVNLILTTTKTRVHAENETRLLSLNTNDTPAQTKAIFEALADERRDPVDKTPWHQIQEWLQSKTDNRVTIPYAEQLAKFVPPVAVRLRRDFGAFLSLIKTNAILHQATRAKDAEGRIIATLDDYAQVRDLVAPIMSEGVGATVAAVVRETVEAVEATAGDCGAMALSIAEHLKLDKGTVSRRLSVAASHGYIRNLEEKRGKPGRWVKGDPLPEEGDLLPQPYELQRLSDAGCTVAVNSKGYTDCVTAEAGAALVRKLLADLVGAIKAEPGLHPEGHYTQKDIKDCFWSADPKGQYYPSEYTAAVDWLESDKANEQQLAHALRHVVFKIDMEAQRGTPLMTKDGRKWNPPELEASRAYARELRALEEREFLAA